VEADSGDPSVVFGPLKCSCFNHVLVKKVESTVFSGLKSQLN